MIAACPACGSAIASVHDDAPAEVASWLRCAECDAIAHADHIRDLAACAAAIRARWPWLAVRLESDGDGAISALDGGEHCLSVFPAGGQSYLQAWGCEWGPYDSVQAALDDLTAIAMDAVPQWVRAFLRVEKRTVYQPRVTT
jgi:formate dehydrogenase maturation protein FdhE